LAVRSGRCIIALAGCVYGTVVSGLRQYRKGNACNKFLASTTLLTSRRRFALPTLSATFATISFNPSSNSRVHTLSTQSYSGNFLRLTDVDSSQRLTFDLALATAGQTRLSRRPWGIKARVSMRRLHKSEHELLLQHFRGIGRRILWS